jgi:hypothetical protein
MQTNKCTHFVKITICSRNVLITGHIGTKSKQILAYVDDVAILSRSKSALKDTLVNIEKEAGRRGLIVNENKTKCMQVARAVPNDEHLCCGNHKFEYVKEFCYLGSQMNQTNSISSEIQVRIVSGNRCYYAYRKLMKSRALNRSSKFKIYKRLLRPVVTYGCEAWTLTNRDEQHLRIFERRILRKIFGPVQNEDGSWRIRINYELNKLIENADIVRFIESRRIAWLGHVMRMDDKRTPKRILEWKPIGTRIRGRPRKRWIVDIEEDKQIMGIRWWRMQCKGRAEWKRITEKAKTHSGL